MLKKILIVFLLLPVALMAQEKESAGVSELNGIASFYSLNLNGTRTATGEIFKHSNLTAASNFFKINSWVKVTNLKNNQSVIVRINDRMHKKMAAKGRVVDLSAAAAKLLGVNISGLLKVKVESVPENKLAE